MSWAAVSAFVVVGFAGLGKLDWRKAISIAGVLLVLIVLPVYVLTVGNTKVGDALQPRYLLPLILLLCLLLVTMPRGAVLRFTRLQTFLIVAALAGANLVALQVNIRRYVTGDDEQGLNLDDGRGMVVAGVPGRAHLGVDRRRARVHRPARRALAAAAAAGGGVPAAQSFVEVSDGDFASISR